MSIRNFLHPETPTSSLICSMPPPDGDGAGGGDGATGGGDGGVFTEAQKAEMIRIQNAANSAHHTRMQKVIDQKMSEMQASITASFTEALSAHQSKVSGGNGTSPKPKDETEAMAQMRAESEARMAEMEKKFENERKARMDEAHKAQVAEERSKLGAALRSAGVADERLRGAVALLYTEDKRIMRNAEGQVVFKMQRDGYVDELTVDAGIAEWLTTPEGKHFAPARDVHGSGAQGGKSGQQGNQKRTKREMKRDLVKAILTAERG
jgi:hypothetical protein